MPALIAGNTIIFKPSEQTPEVAEFTVRLWEEAGIPAGVVNLVQGARGPAELLVAHDGVDGVLFTGGVPAGRAIHQALGGQAGEDRRARAGWKQSAGGVGRGRSSRRPRG